MTLYEALAAVVVVSQYTQEMADKALIDQGLKGTDPYSPGAHGDLLNLVAINVLEALQVVSSFSQGDMSVKYNIEARLEQLKQKYEIPGTTKKPTISRVAW